MASTIEIKSRIAGLFALNFYWMSSSPQPRIDRSCTVYILNGTSANLTLVGKGATSGEWDYSTGRTPPASVPPKTLSSEILLRDSFGFAGSEGWMTYRIGNSRETIGMRFACPFSDANWAKWFPVDSDKITLASLLPLRINPAGPLFVQFPVGPPGSRIPPSIASPRGFSGDQILDDGGSDDVIDEIVVTDIPVKEVDDLEASQ
ncbi:hypothetical protein C8R48DRAFT_731105 [Suillus tomentosus]|nr:hypothetical protein C8R48DRAFT_731105 [Suillus tomentosus]